MNFTTLTEKINRNYPLDFGNVFNQSFELFKKSWLQGLLFLLLSMVMVLPALLIIYIPLIGAAVAGDYSQFDYGERPDFPMAFLLPFILVFIVVMFFVNTIVFAMTAGFYKILRKLDHNEEASINELFVFMKWNYLKKIFVISLMVLGISLLAVLLCYLPIFYVMVPLYFTSVIFAFNPELSPSEVIKASFAIGNKKWFIAFGLIFVSSILSQLVGLLMCVIGIFFTASFVYNPIYYMYKNVIGFDEENELSGIESNA